ncbi:MAG: ThuA domain-containing protein [Candidatus Sumerlaeota bacterium]|nr:ThuA domain-containing protein [Candidatus Sumerlaeota bacterium]
MRKSSSNWLAGWALAAILLSGFWCAAAEETAGAGATSAAAATGKKKIVFIAGPQSHGFGLHAHGAGCMLFAKLLNENMPSIQAVACEKGWPKDPAVLADASAVVLFCDGGSLVSQHLKELEELMKKGVGLACLHYTVEVPKAPAGEKMLEWIGGYFEVNWSVNPTWDAEFKSYPDHPITRGLKPFKIQDEWYYHIRFVPEMKNVTPVLSAIPPDSTRKGPDGARSGNADVRARMGMPEALGWAFERPDGGRGFGFTGLHTQWNLAQDSYRKALLNAFVWLARAEVPKDGVPSKTPTLEELEANQTPAKPANYNADKTRQMIEKMNR